MRMLQEPLTIRTMTVKNRIVMPPMAVSKGKNGLVSDALADYYFNKTKSGSIGLVITEHMFVSPDGCGGPEHLSIAENADIPGIQRIADIVHRNGSRIFAQIDHTGGKAQPVQPGSAVVGPSAIIPPCHRRHITTVPHPLSKSQIDALIAQFADSALRAQQAGCDGVEIHAAHGYLLNEFYSPITNRRTDEYSGYTLAGRCRLIEEILQAIRHAAGGSFLISVRFGACDHMPNGSTLEESGSAARRFATAGADIIDVSGGLCGTNIPGFTGTILFEQEARVIKKSVSVPVILTGGITEPEEAESLLENQEADLIGVGRALLKDNQWADKALL